MPGITKITRGKFITLEGIDGAGKSTHLNWLKQILQGRGHTVIVTREPGGTPLGETLRRLLLDHSSEALHPETEALLMFAARREHIDKVIKPALQRGDWVISDRFSDASFAYQGGGRGLPVHKLDQLEQWVQESFQADLTLYFDVDVELARRRRDNIKPADRFESERDAFFERVRSAYLARARHFPLRIRVIDSQRTIQEVQKELEKHIISICYE